MFQSPSLRGSGRFRPTPPRPRGSRRRFNPLHCGAVVASGRESYDARPARPGFNPLHCGAVVASESVRRRGMKRNARFNPLHCGAVVASARLRARLRTAAARVSIPFIAGQWSLPGTAPVVAGAVGTFQSPSLRGSGRFGGSSRSPSATPGRFNPLHCGAVVASSRSWLWLGPDMRCFNPLHCGAVVASGGQGGPHGRGHVVSIPFIAGQWSLLAADLSESRVDAVFQSPSLRGSGRFKPKHRRGRRRRRGFQSPSLRGSGRFLLYGVYQAIGYYSFNPLHCGAVVASLCHCPFLRAPIPRFNPLHCGAVVASAWATAVRAAAVEFQSPSLRGSGRFREGEPPGGFAVGGFNPLHCGAVVASR